MNNLAPQINIIIGALLNEAIVLKKNLSEINRRIDEETEKPKKTNDKLK